MRNFHFPKMIISKINVKSFTTALVLLSGSIIICLGAAEGILRIKNRAQDVYDIEMWRYSNQLIRPSSNSVLGHEHVPLSRSTLQKTLIRINELGFRGNSISQGQDGKGHRRILFLGGSITLGWGVAEEKTLTARLEAMFLKDGEDNRVFNAGIANYNAVRYVEGFFANYQLIRPTDIVVHYFINDAEILEPPKANFILRNSQLAFTIWLVLNRITESFGSDNLMDRNKSLYANNSPGFKAMKQALKRLSNFADKKGIRLYLAMTPDIHNLIDYKLEFVHDKMAALSTELGYRFIDLLPAMAGIIPDDIWAIPGDPHPNSLGHKIMAETIYPVLLVGK